MNLKEFPHGSPFAGTFFYSKHGIFQAGDIIGAAAVPKGVSATVNIIGNGVLFDPSDNETPEQLLERILEAKAKTMALQAGLFPKSSIFAEFVRLPVLLDENQLAALMSALSSR